MILLKRVILKEDDDGEGKVISAGQNTSGVNLDAEMFLFLCFFLGGGVSPTMF